MTPTWTTEALYHQGLTAAYEMGLTGEAAIQYANQQAAQTTSSSWLPYIGIGSAVVRWLSGDITAETTLQLAGTLGTMACSYFAVINLPAALMRYLMGQANKHAKKYVKYSEPQIEVVYQENDIFYLKGLNNYGDIDHPCGTDDDCKQTYLRYNAKTNTLEMTDIFVPGRGHKAYNPSAEEFENATWREFDPVLWQMDPEDFDEYNNMVAWLVNVPSLQAQIYNQVLQPNGYTSEPKTRPINIGGKEYYVDDANIVYRTGGQIVGKLNPDTGEVESFMVQWMDDGCRLRTDGTIDVEHGVLGGVSDSPAYVPSDNFRQIGMGELDGVQPSADFVTPYIGEEGITYEQYIQLEQAGSVRLG
jgi:hypothetical protein